MERSASTERPGAVMPIGRTEPGLMGRISGARVWPALAWLGLLGAALWPVWIWMGRRMIDGSDDPLGGLALAVLGVLVIWQRRHFRLRPHWLPLGTAVAGVVLATALHHRDWPSLAVALVALLSLACGLLAWLPKRVARAPVWGLAVLSLPVLASLQFYAGFPMRVLTAELSGWLLRLGHTVDRAGSSLWVDGQLVIVDAPCSGVQMVWLGYFTACTVALARRRTERAFMLRLPAVGVLVLAGNVLRNTVLVAAQAADAPLTGWPHDAVGLLVLGAVCGGISWIMGRAQTHRHASRCLPLAPRLVSRLFRWPEGRAGRHLGNKMFGLGAGENRRSGLCRHAFAALAAFVLLACALSHQVGGISALEEATGAAHQAERTGAAPLSEWPTQWQGAPLRPLALSEVEQRFASQFPGRLARLTDGQKVLVLRTVTRPTRMLHPAADCYRGLGYQIANERLELQDDAQPWRCFEARRAGRAVRVCERIGDEAGSSYADTSTWYWAAVWGRTSGPWTAVTVATPIRGS